jgi:hypothetical protein
MTADTPNDFTQISTTALAAKAKLAQSAVRRALADLGSLGYITTRAATATEATKIQVNAFRTVQLGVPLRGTPPASKGHTECLFEAHPVPLRGTPSTENKGEIQSKPPVDTSSSSNPILNRVLNSRTSKADPALLAYTRHWLHGYMAKLGVDDAGQPLPNPHPPDDQLVAQVLAIADPPEIFRTLDALLLERKEVYNYGWFVSVLLQRIHGIHWSQTKQARATLRVVRAGKRAAAVEPEQLNLTEEIARIAAGKAFR